MQKESGVTIVEVVVATVLLGLVAITLTTLFMTIRNAQMQIALLDTSTRAAERQIESLRNNNYASLTPGEDIDFSSDLPELMPDGSTGTVEVTEPVAGLRRVDVTITYPFLGKTREVAMSSMIGVIGITQ